MHTEYDNAHYFVKNIPVIYGGLAQLKLHFLCSFRIGNIDSI